MTNTSPPVDADPAALIAEIEARSRVVETPCGAGKMVWHIWGQGDPLVLLHGSSGSWLHWIRNIEALSADRTVIVPDLPGNGDSALPASQSHADLCAPIAAGIRQIVGDGRPVDIVGFSFGGVVAGFLAALHPEVARRIVVIGCGGLDIPHGETFRRRLAGTAGEERIAAVRYNLLGMMLHHPESADDLAVHLQFRDGPRARLKWVAELVQPDKLIRILPQVEAPIDAIWGEFDRPHDNLPMQEQVLRSVQPDMEFRVVEGAGHWAIFERAEAFNREVIDVLSLPLRTVG